MEEKTTTYQYSSIATSAVRDRSTVDVSAVRAELGVTSGEWSDARLGRVLDAAKWSADEYLCNPFLELEEGSALFVAQPEVELPIPPKVELGVIEWCRVYVATISEQNGGGVGVTSERVRDLAKAYDGNKAGLASALADDAAQAFWSSYRLIPGF